MDNNKKILQQPWGGLGDNLSYSTLPEQFHKMGIDFYIHKDNAVRNQEIFDLVWGMNPYVKGVSDETPNCGPCNGWGHAGLNHINRMEAINGASQSEEQLPKIYYKPNIIEEFIGKVVVNLASISSIYSKEQIDLILNNINSESDVVYISFEKNLNEKKPSESIIGKNGNEHVNYVSDENATIVDSIFEHCDIIHSCKKYVCLFSGACVLASAIKGVSALPEVEVYIKGDMRNFLENENGYNFKNLTYKFV